MYEFELFNKLTGEYEYTFGYSAKNMFKRYGLNENEWTVLSRTYID